MALEPSITQRWEHREGRNAAYEIYVLPEGGGWVVNFANGSIGGTLRHGTKTPDGPVAREEAMALLAKLEKERKGKGYKPVTGVLTSGPIGSAPAPKPPVGTVTDDKIDTGVRVQLLNEIIHLPKQSGEPDLERLIRSAAGYIFSAEWLGQQKRNGERNPIVWDGGELTGANRVGEQRVVPPDVAEALLPRVDHLKRTVLDGEMEGGVWYCFDLLEYNGVDWRNRDFSDRAARAKQVIDSAPAHPAVQWVEVATTPNQKLRMLQALYAIYQDGNDPFCAAEGMVFKKRQSKYTANRPNSGGNQMKLKFWRDVDVVIVAQKPGKRSVMTGLYNAQGKLEEMGYITIPANHDIPKPGMVAKVRYLTCQRNGSLYQPQYEGVRTDKRPAECTRSQLVYWPGGPGEVDA